jgi:PAS domain S-box-containing protein
LYASRLQKEKAQQFAAIIDFVLDGIIAIDNRGCITVFNSSLEKITGFSRQDAIGKQRRGRRLRSELRRRCKPTKAKTINHSRHREKQNLSWFFIYVSIG